MRIDKFLVSQNICTRKEAQKLVRKGLVKIDSEIVKKPETKLDPNINKVTVDGKEISLDTVSLFGYDEDGKKLF